MSTASLEEALQRHRAGDHARAERLYKDILRAQPDNRTALYNLGFLYGEHGNFSDAERLMGEVIALDPTADAYFMRGSALLPLARDKDAIDCFDRAIALKPDFPEARLNRASALFRLKRYVEAREDYDRLLKLDTEYPFARGNRLFCGLHGCDWRDLDGERAMIAAGLRAGKRIVTPFDVKALGLTAADELQCVQIWTADQVRPVASYEGAPYRHDRIRVAYLAAQFGDDPVSSLIAGVIAHHDRRRFEIGGVALRPGSAFQDAWVNAFDIRVEGGALNDVQLVLRLREMEIDIAVDLMGFTEGGRPGVLALRPAPVQVNYLGFPGTMGARFIDYILADRIVIPAAQRECYSERVVTLPHSYMCTDNARAVSGTMPSRSGAGLPESGFVFASFNNSYKFQPAMFDIWMRLLRAVAGSVLWLPKSNPAALHRLSCEAEARGVEPDRLVFAPFVPKPEDHLARLRLADLFLDTLPYNAHSTAVDALWAGVPVLTCEGETFSGRVASSLLHAAGMPELVAQSLDDYETRALDFARNPDALAAATAKLADMRCRCALFDTRRFTRHLESAYTAMWERAERALPPEDFAVAEDA